jgi:hypothetical protein
MVEDEWPQTLTLGQLAPGLGHTRPLYLHLPTPTQSASPLQTLPVCVHSDLGSGHAVFASQRSVVVVQEMAPSAVWVPVAVCVAVTVCVPVAVWVAVEVWELVEVCVVVVDWVTPFVWV